MGVSWSLFVPSLVLNVTTLVSSVVLFICSRNGRSFELWMSLDLNRLETVERVVDAELVEMEVAVVAIVVVISGTGVDVVVVLLVVLLVVVSSVVDLEDLRSSGSTNSGFRSSKGVHRLPQSVAFLI